MADKLTAFDSLSEQHQIELLQMVEVICGTMKEGYDSFSPSELAAISYEMEHVATKLVQKAVTAFMLGSEPHEVAAKIMKVVETSKFLVNVVNVAKRIFV